MIDKLSNINAGNSQSKKVSEDSRAKDTNVRVSKATEGSASKKAAEIDISADLNVKMTSEAPIDTAKVSAIKNAVAKGEYPIDLDKVADALLQAYQDIK